MPRVYDKQGHELTVGARVREACDYADSLEVTALTDLSAHTRHLVTGTECSFPIRRWDGSNRCTFLLLIDSPTEGKEG